MIMTAARHQSIMKKWMLFGLSELVIDIQIKKINTEVKVLYVCLVYDVFLKCLTLVSVSFLSCAHDTYKSILNQCCCKCK